MASATDLFDGRLAVMVTKAQKTIPRPAAAGQLAYEMKWDGYRAALQVRPDGVRLWSRNGTDISAAFADLVEAASVQVPPGIVLDGEAVAWVDGRLSFDHLQQRMAASTTTATTAPWPSEPQASPAGRPQAGQPAPRVVRRFRRARRRQHRCA